MATKKNRRRRNPRNGYVVYPSSTGHMSLRTAKAAAKRESKREGYARVESVDTGRTVASYSYGKLKSNPRKRVTSRRKKNPVRVAASMAGKSTGWMPAKAVRVVKGKGGQVRVDVKR